MRHLNIPLLGITAVSGLILSFLLFVTVSCNLRQFSPIFAGFFFLGLLLKLVLELFLLKTVLQAVILWHAEQKLHEKD